MVFDIALTLFVISLCLLISIGGRFIRRTENRVIRALTLPLDVIKIGYELEKGIGSAYSRFAHETDGWESNGRLNRSLDKARSDFKLEQAALIHAARQHLDALETESRRLGLEAVFKHALVEAASEYPSLGIVRN